MPYKSFKLALEALMYICQPYGQLELELVSVALFLYTRSTVERLGKCLASTTFTARAFGLLFVFIFPRRLGTACGWSSFRRFGESAAYGVDAASDPSDWSWNKRQSL